MFVVLAPIVVVIVVVVVVAAAAAAAIMLCMEPLTISKKEKCRKS